MNREYFKEFVAEVGGNKKAAELLGVSVVLIDKIKAGTRKVSPNVALKIEKLTDGKYDKARLVWGDAA